MSFKDVLIALTTYPEPTPVSAVDDAVDLAAAFGAKVSAIACEVYVSQISHARRTTVRSSLRYIKFPPSPRASLFRWRREEDTTL
jgi:hypothetical protein